MDPRATFRPTSIVRSPPQSGGALSLRRSPPGEPHRHASGFATLHFVVAAGFSMLFFVLLANLLVVQYGRAAVRVALDEGARHGARRGIDPAGCETRVESALSGLLGGEMGSGISYRCQKDRERTRVDAEVEFPAWLPGLPDYRFNMAATATSERP